MVLGLSAVALTAGVSGAAGGLQTAGSAHCPEGTTNQVAVARVNINGPRLTVGDQVWSADPGVQADAAATVAEDRDIRKTRADALYRTSRVGEFRYEAPVTEAGQYVVRMHFVEPWFGVDGRPGGRGSRVFSISVEDGRAGSRRVDVAAAAGGPLRAWTKSWTTRVDDGNVTIEGRGIRDLPVVSAIEVLRKQPRGTCVPVSSTTTPSGESAADGTPEPEAAAPAPPVEEAPQPETRDDTSGAPQTPAPAPVPAPAPPAAAAPAPPAAGGTIGLLSADSGRPFAAASVWNTPIPTNPAIDRNSAAMVRSVTSSNTATANLYAYGEPVFTAVAGTPTARVTCTENWGTCDVEKRTMRIPAEAQPTTGSDGRMIIVDLVDRVVCDFWQARKAGTGQWTTSWATCADLTGTGSGPNGGATGAGVNALTGVVRTFEMRNLHIPHTLSVATNNSCSGQFRAPAVKTDGQSGRADCVPEGARLQLDPSIDVNAIPNMTPGERAVARALQVYGAINRDNCGSNLCVQFEAPFGEADPYPAAGFTGDYYRMPHIPWNQLRVLAG
ncbi:malectin domain-containing carbohydrate-binding protein [Geodermatophilus sabuli]|uniref:Di-glucose binding within endoplasmic reticulum n=1 Tax=Geodermatophilus sabuli TaxID=1564158 RepID=A0A285ECU5_9ACTN|nr:malectin domain-containing carbohydrate-binding protein [Geodermatophilus sabuli]MBB3083606.1 hypothetical protein [Geodermatophilus sabuli]SNX96673.1 Di-glucose binding within endoplasmic reticulum [Geodermatophilus sabuli]